MPSVQRMTDDRHDDGRLSFDPHVERFLCVLCGI